MPHLYGERVRLRAAEKTDIPLFLKWVNDPEVTENLMMHFPLSSVEEEKWYEDMLSRPQEEHVFVIEKREASEAGEAGKGWTAIGTMQLHGLSWRVRKSEVGIMIGEKACWDQGYGTDAMRVLLRFGFETLNLHRIWLQVYEKNKRAIRSYEKAGFSQEGVYRDGHYQHGRYYDIILMSVLREEWEKSGR